MKDDTPDLIPPPDEESKQSVEQFLIALTFTRLSSPSPKKLRKTDIST